MSDGEKSILGTHNNLIDDSIEFKQMQESKRNIDKKVDEMIERRKNRRRQKEVRYPAIFHIITKKDMMTENGYAEYLLRMEEFRQEGLVDRFFFTSSTSM